MKLMYFKEGRHATWIELFFDLIFVVLIGRITHFLDHIHNGHIENEYLVKFPLLFIPIWWIWYNHTIYNNIYDENSKIQKFMTLIIMLLVTILSVFITVDFQRANKGFLIIFTLIRLVIAFMYIWLSKKHEECRNYSVSRGAVYIIGAMIGISSLFFPIPIRYVVFYLSILFELLVSYILEKKMTHVEIHVEHLLERAGLLTLILLGETFITLVGVLQKVDLNIYNISGVVFGFIIIASFWWIYFDSFEFLEKSKKLKSPTIVLIPHMFLYMGLAILANVIRETIIGGLSINSYKSLLFTGLVLFYIGKQIPYAVAFPRVRKRQLQNTLVVFILTGFSFLLNDRLAILIVTTIILFVYMALNYMLILRKNLEV